MASGLGADQILAKVRERFGRLPRAGAPTAVRAIEPPPSGPKRITIRHSGPHAQVLVAFRAPSLGDSDFPALVLFDALLAGGRGFAGSILRSAGHGGPYPRASGTLLDQSTAGLASAVRSDWQVSTYPYVYTLSATVAQSEGLGPAEAALFGALDAAASKAWTPADLSRALHQVRTAVALDTDDQRGRVHQLALFEVSGGFARLETLPEQVARVTLEEVRRFARERLGRDRATVGWFDPQESTAASGRATAQSALPTPEASPRSRTPAPQAAAGATLSAVATFRTTSGISVAVQPLRGALATLRGRIEVTGQDGVGSGFAAFASTLLADPIADEGADAPSLSWTPRHDPIASVNLNAIEFTTAVLPEDVPAALSVVTRRLTRPPPEGTAFEDLKARAVRHAEEQNATVEGKLLARALVELFPPDPPRLDLHGPTPLTWRRSPPPPLPAIGRERSHPTGCDSPWQAK